ncbi:MAG: TRAM domain-containing protein [Spirochaetes bacterium]|nr:TRAM domain-containing protein [Spirochaetota bacterium]MBU1080076.1 TRAM domain-containing protein [Spirochaetota bacterium]
MATLGETLRIAIERIVPGGDGMGRVDGQAVFVPFSAPGDLLEARLVERKAGYARAEIVAILEPGPGRAEPSCPYYGECGGCNLQHLGYEAQLEAKQGIARDAWLRSGGIADVGFDVVPCSPLGYRNRAQFHEGASGRLGYARRASSDILEVRSCPVLVPALRLWLESGAGMPGKAGKAATDGRFVAFGYGERVYLEGVDREATVEVGGKAFRFDPGGFFQSNLEMVERLAPAVCAGLSGERAADLYCGVGLFAAFLREGFGSLCCVEQEKRSIGLACSNVGPGAAFAASRIEEWTRSPQARARFDYVVVDPPRAGLGAQVRAWLASSRPERIGYVSCDPVSLARDAGFLVKAGYEVESASLLDFYPQNSHVESHVRFRLA